jgi:hypothetical protein
MVSPPPEVGSGAGAAATSPANTGTQAAPSSERGAAAPSAPAAALDRADIRPLDLQGALQILVAEVQLSLVEAFDNGSARGVNAAAQDLDGPVPAARVIVDLVMQSLPANFEPDTWSVALPRADAALQAAVQSAIQAVGAWRDVTPAVVAAAREAGALAQSLIADDPPYPLWPPPEWMGLAPRLGRLWRRRRALKRLLDPDYEGAERDDLDELG